MLFTVIVFKALVEVALLSMLAQGVLHLFAGARREDNLMYRLFAVVNRPVLRATRAITPRLIVDQHVGFVAFLLLMVVWVGLVAAKVHFFLAQAAR